MSYFSDPLINAEEKSSHYGRGFKRAYRVANPMAQEAALTKRARSLPLFSGAQPLPPPALSCWRLNRYHANKIADFTTSDYQKDNKLNVTKVTAKA
jgi:hypothetical protein